MSWVEFRAARQHLAEERVGKRIRDHDRSELDTDEQSKDLLRARGMIDG